MLKSTSRSDTLYLRELFRKSGKQGKIALLLSSWFWVGLLPGAPGTFGALFGIPVAIGLRSLGSLTETLSMLVFLALAYWACDIAWRMAGEDDPRWVVIDEVAGLLVSVFGAASGFIDFSLGFVLFRIFDVWKPYPICRMERLHGAKGILMDDLLAGVFANLCLRIIHLFR